MTQNKFTEQLQVEEARIAELIAEGMSCSDAQAVMEAEEVSE
jgi:uncharacterized protein YoaH (UPF0181 family)